MKAVERWLADRAIVPIENSLGGSIHRNYDLLLHHKLEVVGEVYYSVRYCLLANHGVEIADLKRVLSHPHVYFSYILEFHCYFSLLFILAGYYI